MWQEVAAAPVDTPASSFASAVEVWVRKAHVVNRRLCGALLLWECHYTRELTSCMLSQLQEDLLAQAASQETVSKWPGVARDKLAELFPSADPQPEATAFHEVSVFVRALIPKRTDRYHTLKELVILERSGESCTFVPLLYSLDGGCEEVVEPSLAYRLQLTHCSQPRITLSIVGVETSYNAEQLGYSVSWLRDTLLLKLARWSAESKLNTANTSLKLLCLRTYNQVYHRLKEKYAKGLVEMWPETTDPQKFVYEDIAIAAYLLVLWNSDRQSGVREKQSFVDLGCGNGLLVYLLQAEGHRGLGVDVRRRKIWDMYGKDTKLVELAITPSDSHLFPSYDWLIGNHSDELTPWIPVIANRSAYKCNFMVLPCCPWDFAGKFNQKTSGSSHYRNYLRFVQQVGETCGFKVEEDTLRIPSTKRVCLIGRERNYPEGQDSEVDKAIGRMIESRCRGAATASSQNVPDVDAHGSDDDWNSVKKQRLETDGEVTEEDHMETEGAASSQTCWAQGQQQQQQQQWAGQFKARPTTETTRNCVRVDKAVKDHVLDKVFTALLEVDRDSSINTVDGRTWRTGGRLSLGGVASMFAADTLKQMKSECGGLQTMLRNCHDVFRVQAGCVQLRDWSSDDYAEYKLQRKKKKGKIFSDVTKLAKTRLCFFHTRHPDACPLIEQTCRFAHSPDELKEKPVKEDVIAGPLGTATAHILQEPRDKLPVKDQDTSIT